MKCCYASQNDFGNLCDEKVYENDVALRLRSEGVLDVSTQLPVKVSHRNFSKIYFLDLVVGQMVYEFKAENRLSSAHEAQALNYAALLSLNRIKLVNFGEESVKGKLLGAPFDVLDRFRVVVDTSSWQPMCAACERFAETAKDLAASVGGYLTTELYRDALIAFHGGEIACLRRLPVSRDGLEMGTHLIHQYTDGYAFVVTSLGELKSTFKKQLHSLLASLPIRGIQLVNIHHCNVQLITIA